MSPPRKLQDAEGHGIEIVTIEADQSSPAQVRAALTTLTRIMLRIYRESGDCVANPGVSEASFAFAEEDRAVVHLR